MKVIASFVGRNKDFKAWLAAGMPQNVICLAEYREKKKAVSKRRPTERKPPQLLPQVYQMGLLEGKRGG